MNKGKEYEEFKRLCLEHNRKCTPQRYAVYHFMKGNPMHPSIDDVWKATRKVIPSITRESVFRILLEFADSNLIYRMDKIENARFDGIARSHGHLICDKCGAILDFELPPDGPVFPQGTGFQPRHAEVRITGLCSKCAAESQKDK